MPEYLPGLSDYSELLRGLFTSFGDKPFVGLSAGVWTYPSRRGLRCSVQRGVFDQRISFSGKSSLENRQSGAAVRNCIRLEH